MQKTRREFLKEVGVGAMGLGGVVVSSPGLTSVTKATPGEKKNIKPNIILILTDDQGWTDTSVQMMAGRADSKSDFYRTPALERMAREGMVFSNAYAPAPVCTPTRVSIQFGKTPARLRDTGHYRSARKDFDDEVSIAQAIKATDQSYAAAHYGKWGGQATTPERAGYDRSDGKTNNYHGDWRSLKDKRPIPLDNPKQIFGLTQRACEFMEDHVRAGRPFYLQVSHYAVHSQHRALKETIEKYRNLPRGKKCTPEDYQSPPPGVNHWMLEYAAMIENLDTGIEGILNKIDELGIAESTYVIFFSDNGGDFRGNAPLRGQKSELWEGGIRVPMVVRGPGIKPGSYCDEPVTGWDFLPTFVDLAGGDKKMLPRNHDGGSLRPLFENDSKGKIDRPVEGIVFHFPDFQGVTMSAIRLGDYKLLKDWETGKTHLYNLVNDLSERRNLVAEMPGKANELYLKLMDYLGNVNAEKAEDIHLDSLQQAIEQKRQLEIKIRELLDSEDLEGKDKWSQLNMGLGFQDNRIKQLQERLRLINEANRKEAKPETVN